METKDPPSPISPPEGEAVRKSGGILRRDPFLSQGLMLTLFGLSFPISSVELTGLVHHLANSRMTLKTPRLRFLICNS